MAATDAAMELLEQVQHDFGEDPYLQALPQDRAVVVEDLGAAPAWARIEAVVGQLHIRGLVSVPVGVAGQPVGRWMYTAAAAGLDRRLADERNHAADERKRRVDEREWAADDRDRIADERDRVVDERDRTAGHPD